MVDVFNIAVQCNTILQIIGLLIIALFLTVIAILVYKAIRFIAFCLLSFRKIDVTIDKSDIHCSTRLCQ